MIRDTGDFGRWSRTDAQDVGDDIVLEERFVGCS